MTPRFTILIAVRDRAAPLARCVDCLAALHGPFPAELIVACDGGPQGMREAVALLEGRTGWEVRWLQLPPRGPAAARNAALDYANGELVLFLNDDVRFGPDLLHAHHAAHASRPGHAVMGNTRWAPEVIDSEFMHWVAHADSFYYLIPDELSATWEYFHTMNLSVDRRWFAAGHRFDESFPDPAFEDTELGYRLWKEGLRLGFAAEAVLYHVHPYTREAYIAKSVQRGASARRFCSLYPELEKRILGGFDVGRPSLMERLGFGDPAARWQRAVSRAFLAGYRGAPSANASSRTNRE